MNEKRKREDPEEEVEVKRPIKVGSML